jgi:geranylgeranyl pyrophosphate synthase
MDDDDLRRGKPTCHKVYGEAIAILAGDALLTRAFHLIVDLPADADGDRVRRRLQAAAILGQACGTTGLIGGQVLDLESRDARWTPPRWSVCTGRRRARCSPPACAGARSWVAPPGHARRLDRYASAIGLAFQVVDDLWTPPRARSGLGKTAGKDSAAGKATYVAVHGLDGARTLRLGPPGGGRAALAPLGSARDDARRPGPLIVERRA